MKLTPPGLTRPPERGLFNETERKRIKWLLFAFLLVLVSFTVMLVKETRRRQEEAALARSAPPQEAVRTVTVTPQVDADALRALAQDATPAQRVLTEPKALASAFRDTMLVNDQLFEPMQGALLDAAALEELAARSLENRGRLFRAYGTVDDVLSVPGVDGLQAHARGRLQLEHGGWAYFAVLHEPESGLAAGEFVRVDGVFVKLQRREGDGPDGWIDGPLLAGPRAVRAWPRMDELTELDPGAFADVTDDSVSGITGQPFFPYWELVGYVRSLAPDTVDWSQTPVLDRETMNALALDGARFRAQPMRIPVSQVMDCWVQAQDENPLRLARMTEGWIGNEKWFGPTNGVIRFVSPHVVEDVRRRDDVLASGFFLKHLAYEPSKGGVAVAPFFVLHSIETFTPTEDRTWQVLLAGFGGLMLLLGVSIFLLMRRDRRRSTDLQEELRARRRARQQRAGATT